jgi:hypothetical protein
LNHTPEMQENKDSSGDPRTAVVTPVVTSVAEGASDCPELAALVALWKRLPPAIRSAVRAMAEAAATLPTSSTSPTPHP